MPAMNKLTDAKVRGLKPGDKPRKVSDGGGLYLWISPTGARAWRAGYRLHGKEQTAAFGPYPEVSLAEARIKRDELKAQLRAGGDPRGDRRAARTPTVKEVVEGYWAQRLDVSPGYREMVLSCMARVVYPVLGGTPCAAVTEADVLAALNRLNAEGKYDYVRKARGWLGQAFDYAKGQGWCAVNPCAGINPRRAFGKRKVAHFPSLKLHEVGDFMRRLDLESGDMVSALACRFIAYTWVRTKEARNARFADIRDGVWEIDASVMKKHKEHIVPLPRQALAIVEKLEALQTGSPFLFPGGRTIEKQMSENAVLALIYRMGYKGKMSGHGWRSVASTWANEAGYSPDAVERQLAHVPGDKTRAAYNRAAYIKERREMLAAWADWVDAQSGSRPSTSPG